MPIDWLQTGTFTIRATAESDLPDLDSTNDTSTFVTVVQDPSDDTDGDGIENAIDGRGNVEVLPFSNLLIQFARAQKACVIIKGLRAISVLPGHRGAGGHRGQLQHRPLR